MRLNKNIKIFFNYFLGPVLFVWLSYSVYRQVQRQPDLLQSWRHIRASLGSSRLWYLFFVVVLMAANWFAEAIKWRLSVKGVQQVSIWKSLKAVLSGVAFAVSTPNRMGEYLGRVLYMDEGNRLRTIALTILGSMSQLIVTLAMGTMGLIALLPVAEQQGSTYGLWVEVLLFGVLAALVILTIFYFRLSWVIRWTDKLPGLRKYAYLIEKLEEVDATLLLRLLSLSLVRFVIFIIQYYFVFQLFDVQIGYAHTLWGVSVSFLVMAMIPTIALLELVQRGKVMLSIIGLFSVNSLGIGFAATTIWFINLIVPSVLGSLLILGIRIFKQKDEV